MNKFNNHITLSEKIGLYSFAASSHDLSVQVLSTTLLFSLLVIYNDYNIYFANFWVINFI